MLRYNKSLPRGFIVFTLFLFILPGNWLNPVGLFLLTPLRPLTSLFSSITPKDEVDEIGNLKQEIQDLKSELLVLHNENRELTKKLKDRADFVETQADALNINKFYRIIIADVIISHDATSWRKSIMINRGTSSGITTGLPVISGKYLVGKVSEASLFTSRVQLITDPSFRGKAIIIPVSEKKDNSNTSPKSTDSKRASSREPSKGNKTVSAGTGVLAGYSTNQCMLKWVSRDIPVKPGWQVFSAFNLSSTGTPCPKNLIVGEVTQVREESYFYRLTVKPAVDFNSLESVMVLKKKDKNEN